MKTDKTAYLNKLLKDIEVAKGSGRTGIFRMKDAISNEVATHVRNYFVNKPEYRIEMRKCPNCTHEWDIYIWFKKEVL